MRSRALGAIGPWTGRILLGLAAVVLAVVGLGPLTGRYRLVTVLSGSMAPGMPVGSVAVLVPEDPAAVRVGDVITFQAPMPDDRTVTHRVVEIVEGGHHPVLRTKGDANPVADPWTARLAGDRAWRRVAVVPYGGTAIRALRSSAVHRLTIQVVPVVLLASMLLAIWWPGRLSRRRRAAVLAVVALVAATPAALAAFIRTTTAANNVTSAADWFPPSVGSTVVAKQTGYLAGAIKQGGSYYVYANVADSGNPASGVSTAKADVSAVTTGSTAVSLTPGSYSVNGVGYGYRSALLTANATLSGTKSYTITSTDVLAHAQTQSGYSVVVDNTLPTATDIQTTNHAGGTAGRAETGDTIVFTFSEQLDPQSVLGGWTGASTGVSVRVEDGGCLLNLFVKVCSDDSVEVYSGASPLATLGGPINLHDPDYNGGGLLGTAADAVFNATMAQSGSSITVTLGGPTSGSADIGGSTLMTWSWSGGPYDAAGNVAGGNAVTESGSAAREF
jgi:signal peptidase I